jgi:hypothetical protein
VSDQQQYITEYSIATNVKQRLSMSNLITYTAITFTRTSTWYKDVCKMFMFKFKNSHLPKYPAFTHKCAHTSKCAHSPQNTYMPWFEVLTCFPKELLLNYFIIFVQHCTIYCALLDKYNQILQKCTVYTSRLYRN